MNLDSILPHEHPYTLSGVTNSSYNTTFGNATTDTNSEVADSCTSPNGSVFYDSILLGTKLAVPEWEAVLTALTLTAIILVTIVGNILVILSVFTYKPLRIVQNFFIVSLAVADLTVAILVLPFNVAYSLIGRWIFGIHVCKMWLTCDVLCCTASILNLCAIALDRYWAITDPINYAQKRTLKRVLFMIAAVWLVSLIISSPPLAGWNDWPEHFSSDTPCQLTSQQGYVIYSSLGSFYIPLFIMTLVYIEIYIATKKRLRERAKASRLAPAKQQQQQPQPQVTVPVIQPENVTPQGDGESASSETNHTENRPIKKRKKRRKKGSVERRRQSLSANNGIQIEDDANSATEMMQQSNHMQVCTSPAVKPKLKVDTHINEAGKCALMRKNTVYQFIEERQRISLSKERRAARTLGIIMGVFVVCWLPFFLMYVILPFCPSCCPSEKLINFITWLGYINSALNPIIYTIFNLDFRKAFKKLLRLNRKMCWCFRQDRGLMI